MINTYIAKWISPTETVYIHCKNEKEVISTMSSFLRVHGDDPHYRIEIRCVRKSYVCNNDSSSITKEQYLKIFGNDEDEE